MAGATRTGELSSARGVSVAVPSARAVIIGFGTYARAGTVGKVLAEPHYPLRVDAVSGLQRGRAEYNDTVVPFFRHLGLTPPQFFEDVSAALAHVAGDLGGSPRLALVSTPTGHHHRQTAAALDAGFHVYVERPVCGPDDDLPALVRTAADSGLAFFTGSQRRVEAVYRVLATTFQQHRADGPVTVRCRLAVGRRLSGWRTRRETSGGGIVVDSGYHVLDMAVWLLADPWLAVEPLGISHADVVTRRDPGIVNDLTDVETTAFGSVGFTDGSLLQFDLSYLAPVDSVLETIELQDGAGASFRLRREQAHHGSAAGRLTCQSADGTVISIRHGDRDVALWEADLQASGAPDKPLRDFIELTTSGSRSPIGEPHPCTAALAVRTWELVRSIYLAARDDQMECV